MNQQILIGRKAKTSLKLKEVK